MIYQRLCSGESARRMPDANASSVVIRGTLLTGRDDDFLGYAFDLTCFSGLSCDCLEGGSASRKAGCSKCTASWVERVGSSISNAHRCPSIRSETPVQPETEKVIFKIEAPSLATKEVKEELVNISEHLSPLGIKVSVGFPESSLTNLASLREFRASLYTLEDCGIDVLLAGPFKAKSRKNPASVIERSVAGLLVSPGLLGLGEKQGACNLVKFEAGVRMLGAAIHEHRKTVIMENVKTPWQRDVVRTIPYHALGGQVSRLQVIV